MIMPICWLSSLEKSENPEIGVKGVVLKRFMPRAAFKPMFKYLLSRFAHCLVTLVLCCSPKHHAICTV